MSTLEVAELLAGVGVVLSMIAISGVLVLAREIAPLRAGLRVAAPPPELRAQTKTVPRVDATTLTSEHTPLPRPGASLLLFVLDRCPPCEILLSEIGANWPRLAPSTEDCQVHIAFQGSREAAEQMAAVNALPRDRVFLDSEGVLAKAFAIPVFPFAYATHREQVVAGGPVNVIHELVSWRDVATRAAHVDR